MSRPGLIYCLGISLEDSNESFKWGCPQGGGKEEARWRDDVRLGHEKHSCLRLISTKDDMWTMTFSEIYDHMNQWNSCVSVVRSTGLH